MRIRQVGLVFIIFAFVAQIFAIVSPPLSKPIGSANNLIKRSSNALPNIRPGVSVIVGAVVVVIAGYFLFRSRLIVKESKIAITDQSGDTP